MGVTGLALNTGLPCSDLPMAKSQKSPWASNRVLETPFVPSSLSFHSYTQPSAESSCTRKCPIVLSRSSSFICRMPQDSLVRFGGMVTALGSEKPVLKPARSSR